MLFPLIPHRPDATERVAPARPARPVRPGAEIELWCRSLGTWARGFVATDVDSQGCRALRLSDRAELPVRFGWRDVRPAGNPRPH